MHYYSIRYNFEKFPEKKRFRFEPFPDSLLNKIKPQFSLYLLSLFEPQNLSSPFVDLQPTEILIQFIQNQPFQAILSSFVFIDNHLIFFGKNHSRNNNFIKSLASAFLETMGLDSQVDDIVELDLGRRDLQNSWV